MHINKSLEYQHLKSWLDTGLVTSTGEKWNFRRKLLTSTFYSGFLEVYLKTVKKEISVLISCFEKKVGKWFLTRNASPLTLYAILLGYKHNAERNSKNKHVEAVDKIASIVQMRFTNIWIVKPLLLLLLHQVI